MLGLFRAYPQRTNGFSSASFIYFGCVPDKIVEHLALRDDLGLLLQLGVLKQ